MIKRIVIAILLFLFIASPVMASDYSHATYYGSVIISNNATTVNNGIASFQLNSQTLINNHMILPDYSDSTVVTNTGADLAYMPPQLGANDWWVSVPSIGANTTITNKLYTGGSANMSGQIRYFPGTEGMTTTDNDTSLEPDDNFTIQQKAFINTSVGDNKCLLYKQDALKIYVSAEKTLTAELASYWASPTGATDDNGTWTNDSFAYDNNLATYAYGPILTAGNFLQLFPSSPLVSDTIRIYVGAGYGATPLPIVDVFYSGDWHTINDGYVTASTWVELPIGSEQLISNTRICNQNNDCDFWVYELQIKQNSKILSLYNISSGNYTVTLNANTANFTFSVGSSSNTTALGGYFVPNNSSNWTSFKGSTTPYAESQDIWINGELRQHIVWQDTTPFLDSSEFHNNAEPTFPASNSPGLTCSLSGYGPVRPAVTGATSTALETAIITDLPPAPPNFVGDVDTSHIPGAEVIDNALTTGNIPHSLFWYPLVFGIAIAGGLWVYSKTRGKGKMLSEGSLLLQSVVSAIIIVFFAYLHVIDMWPVIPFAIEAIAIIVSKRQYGW